jgi:hypothetical protein
MDCSRSTNFVSRSRGSITLDPYRNCNDDSDLLDWAVSIGSFEGSR